MKQLYEKSAKYALWAGIGFSILLLLYLVVAWIGWFHSIDLLITLGMMALSSFTGSWFFTGASHRAEELNSTERAALLEGFQLNELIFQRAPALTPTILLVNASGQQLFTITPTERQPIQKRLSALRLFATGFIVPMTFDMHDLEGCRIASFHFENKGKKKLIYVGNEENNVIGTFELPLMKNTFRHRGILLDGNGNEWRDIQAKSVAGDIDIRDEEERITASYRFGMFPYTMHPAFQAIPMNYYVRLGEQITEEERLAYVGLFLYWYLQSA